MENCVYRFLNKENEIIYEGKAKDLRNRMNNHCHLPKECYEERVSIEYTKFDTEDDMDFAERYYISRHKPKYNQIHKNKNITINISYLNCKKWIKYKEGVDFEDEESIIKYFKMLEKREKEERKRKKEEERIRLIKLYEDELKEKERKKLIKKEDKMKKKIICTSTNETFNNVRNVIEKYPFIETDLLIDICDGKGGYYIHPYFNCYLSFKYYEDYKKMPEENRKIINENAMWNTREIICVTTGERFRNLEYAKLTYPNLKSIKRCLEGLQNYNGIKDNKPLIWEWADVYDKMAQEEIEKRINKTNELAKKFKHVS